MRILAAPIILIIGIGSAAAQERKVAFYSGAFSCAQSTFKTDWLVTKDLDGRAVTKIYYQETGSSRAEWIDMTEQTGENGSTLHDANGNPRLAVTPMSDGLSARWIKGAPRQACSAFTVTKSESARTHYDALFQVLEQEKPTAEDATKAAELTRSAPIIFILPELDQRGYSQRAQDLQAKFWGRYIRQLATDLGSAGISTENGRRQFSSLITNALAGPAASRLSDDNFVLVHDAFTARIDDAMITGDLPPDQLFAGGALFCERLKEFTKHSPWHDFRKVEAAAGLPSNYWSRAVAEEILQGLRSCGQNYVSTLIDTWPRIEDEQRVTKAFVAERKRFLTQPLTLATFVDTNNLSPAQELSAQISTGSKLYQRYFGRSLDARRGEVLQAALSEIQAVPSRDPNDVTAGKTIQTGCAAMDSVGNLGPAIRGELGRVCREATNQIEERASKAAKDQLVAAFEGAQPESEQAKAALSLCEKRPFPYADISAVLQICREKTATYERKEQAWRCEKAVAASGATAALLDTTVEVHSSGPVKIRDLICARPKEKITFETSGVLTWKKTIVNLYNGGTILKLFLAPTEGSNADWKVQVEDEQTKAELSKNGFDAERVTACILMRPSCRS